MVKMSFVARRSISRQAFVVQVPQAESSPSNRISVNRGEVTEDW